MRDLALALPSTALALALALAACGSDAPAAPSCPNDLPAACPAPAPAFAADVDPIFAQRCRPCHVPGGAASARPFETWAEIHASRSAILNQVYACRMPPAGAAPLDDAARATLLSWLVCGAPE